MIDRKLKTSFGEIPRLYHSARRGYSEKLFNDILSISNVNEKGNILDIGCGSGKSLMFFAEKGYNILGLDLSKELVSIAKKESLNYPNVKYKIGSFERTDLPKNHFDLIISGQAFHWLNPKVAYAKIANLLKGEGYLAIFGKFQNHKKSKFISNVRRLFFQYCPDYPTKVHYEGYLENYSGAVKESRLFENPITRRYDSILIYSKEEYKNLLFSFSWISSLNTKRKKLFESDLKRLLEKQKSPLEIPYETVLIMAKKKFQFY